MKDDLPDGFRVIETLRLDRDGPARGEAHLARMARTCAGLGIGFDIETATGLLTAHPVPTRARLTCDRHGSLTLQTNPLPPAPSVWRAMWADECVRSRDPWRSVKTTERGLYDRARAELPEGIDEALFLNERGEIAEGAITTVFLDIGDELLTPPVSAGALPGILRTELICAGRARVARLTPDDLAHGTLYVGNALRGLIRVELP